MPNEEKDGEVVIAHCQSYNLYETIPQIIEAMSKQRKQMSVRTASKLISNVNSEEMEDEMSDETRLLDLAIAYGLTSCLIHQSLRTILDHRLLIGVLTLGNSYDINR